MLAALFAICGLASSADTPPANWWPAEVQASIDRAIPQKPAWERILRKAPESQRPGYAYLIRYLPLTDLEHLPPEALVANIALAYQAKGEVAWGATLPIEVFLDAVLPHASVTEPRDSSRQMFHDRYLPLVQSCKTPGEAALLINKHLFVDYKVTYNTRRLRTDQNAKESIAQGMATCTGLSIMFVEACRSLAIPARLAGIPSWPGQGGNHTWAEVWNDTWHFVGAAEPDENGLDHAWFVGDAAKAIQGEPEHAIYAVTYRETGVHFPVVWNAKALVNAENVSERYQKANPSPSPAAPRLMVEVRRDGERVEAVVNALNLENGETVLSGKSLGGQADINLHLSAAVKPGATLQVVARQGGECAFCAVKMKEDDTVVRLDLDAPSSDRDDQVIAKVLADRFGVVAEKKALAQKLLAETPFQSRSRALAWSVFKSSPKHEALRKEFDAKLVKTENRESPYRYRKVGEKPKEGWSLVIAMHGGGGAPQAVNDSQWDGMFRSYYKDHPEVGGYVYLALRAPNNEWNGFYDDAIAPLIERLILQFVLFEDVNPNMVETLGASHGGYGAFVIGTKIPDRFAGIHASASAPTPGETQGENLLNTRFTFMVGENDKAYGRAERCQEFARDFAGWREKRGGYAGGFEWKPGVGHSVPDRDKVAEMIEAGPRNPWPSEVVWVESDDLLKHCYWVEALQPADQGRIEAKVVGNTIRLKTENQEKVALWLDARLLDIKAPVIVEKNGGKALTFRLEPTLETYCQGLEARNDPELAAPLRIEIP